MGADFERNFRDLFRYVQEILGNVRLTGQLVLRLAALKDVNLGPVSGPVLDAALRRLGGPGYGIPTAGTIEAIRVGDDQVGRLRPQPAQAHPHIA